MGRGTRRVDAGKLVVLRAAKGWSQAELAAEADVSKKTVENAEAGKPIHPATLVKIARAVGVRPEELFISDTTQPVGSGRPQGQSRPTAAGSPAATAAPTEVATGGGQVRPPFLRTPTVGREKELEALGAEFEAAAAGRGQFVCVTGEPGIGKTTLVEDFLAELAARDRCTIATGVCPESRADTDTYFPFLQAFKTLLGGPPGGALERARNAAPMWCRTLLPGGDSPPGGPAEGGFSFQERIKFEAAELLRELTEVGPVVLFLDDVHWCGAGTIDLLAYLGRKCATMRLLVILTYRPADVLGAKHPLLPVIRELQGHGHSRELRLSFLTRLDLDRYLALTFPDHQFPAELSAAVHERTEGNPMFMTGLFGSLTKNGTLAEVGGGWQLTRPLDNLHLPNSIRDMIESRIDRLDEADRLLLRVASVQGREFDAIVVAEVLKRDVADVEERLQELDRIHGLVERQREYNLPDGTPTLRYRFVHALYQNHLYSESLPTRKADWSGAVAESLVRHYGERCAEVAPDLAVLFEVARAPLRSAEFYLQAARNAAAVFTYREAGKLAGRGLEQLRSVAETPERDLLESRLQIILGGILQATHGYSAEDTGRAFGRARELCRKFEEGPDLFPAAFGLWFFHVMRAELETARGLAEELLPLAERGTDPVRVMQAHWALELTTLHQGEFTRAVDHFQLVASRLDECRHAVPVSLSGPELGTACRSQAVYALWSLGFPDRALACADESVKRARMIEDPHSLCYALYFAGIAHLRRGEVGQTRERAEEMIALAEKSKLPPFAVWGSILRGWARANHGEYEGGVAEVRRALTGLREMGAGIGQLRCLTILTEVLLAEGRADEAQVVLTQALEILDRTGERLFEAHLYRIQGDVFAVHTEPATREQAKTWLRKAADVARDQEAKSFELRALISLIRLDQQRGRGGETWHRLNETYGWFKEGFATADLIEAKKLLNGPA